jgi:hypothetical protein
VAVPVKSGPESQRIRGLYLPREYEPIWSLAICGGSHDVRRVAPMNTNMAAAWRSFTRGVSARRGCSGVRRPRRVERRLGPGERRSPYILDCQFGLITDPERISPLLPPLLPDTVHRSVASRRPCRRGVPEASGDVRLRCQEFGVGADRREPNGQYGKKVCQSQIALALTFTFRRMETELAAPTTGKEAQRGRHCRGENNPTVRRQGCTRLIRAGRLTRGAVRRFSNQLTTRTN